MLLGDRCGRDQPGDLGGDCRRRESALLLPALRAERRPVRDQIVCRRLDVRPQAGVAGESGLQHHQDRVGDLVQLGVKGIRRQLAVEERVAWQRPVGELLLLEQEPRGGTRGGQVAVGQQRRPRLVEVAGEDLPIRAEVGVGRVAGRDRLAPRRGDGGHDRARERLVLACLDHVGGNVVRVHCRRLLSRRQTRKRRGWGLESVVVRLPRRPVLATQRPEWSANRGAGRGDGVGLGGAETKGEQCVAMLVEPHPCGLLHVAIKRRVGGRQRHARSRAGRVHPTGSQ